MKKTLTMAMCLMTMLALTTTAHADAIAGPAESLFLTVRLLPWILVGAVVGVTIFLLRKFWERKK